MRVIARARHSQFPHASLQNMALEMAAQTPPVFPETKPVIMPGQASLIDFRIFKETSKTKKQALSRRAIFAERSKLCALCKQQKGKFIQFVPESACQSLE